ncbi:uncharacterized protein Dmoj_GI21362, partial [Drosophila mojavensis]
NGYMNAVSEISRVMACTPAMSVDVGKTVMTHLGIEFQRMLQADQPQQQQQQQQSKLESSPISRPVSPASSGYHSDAEASDAAASPQPSSNPMWRPCNESRLPIDYNYNHNNESCLPIDSM